MKHILAKIRALLRPETYGTRSPWLGMAENVTELKRYQRLFTADAPGIQPAAKEELRNVPLVWWDVKERNAKSGLPQYAVMGHVPSDQPGKSVLLNTNSPWSAFLCGSQGSGKSHTLSCMLENCLLKQEELGKNLNPLAGLVFHYDRSQGSDVCEAAYLCTSVPTRVLVSRSSYNTVKKKYEAMAKQHNGVIEVQALDLKASHLDIERMKTLMAVGRAGDMPLYMNVVINILRDMAISRGGIDGFNYSDFATRLADAGFTDMQNGPLNLRLDLLESYVDVPPRLATVQRDTPSTHNNGKNKQNPPVKQVTYKPRQPHNQPDFLRGKPGTLTIVDLTDPVVDSDTACVLFDICLSIFVSQTSCGKIVALDDAHNYMGETNAAAAQFTERLLKTIREQRHQGARVVIATQEPSVNPRLLDLCNITMVHRCTSPAWFAVLKKHIAALKGKNDQAIFEQIVRLKVGENLLFCPTAAVGMEKNKIVSMDNGYVKFRTRSRITADGGKSKLANGG